ncbi:MAG: sensor histidine kinase [bacterium]|nr:sensor histidine kinase [bacterium]
MIECRRALRWLFPWMLCVASAGAAEPRPAPVLLSAESNTQIDLTRYTEVFFDPSAALEIDQVRSRPEAFAPVSSRFIDFGLREGRVWLKFRPLNATPHDGVWRLDLRRQFLIDLEVFVQRGPAPPDRLLRHTKLDKFSDRPIRDRYLAVDVPIESHEDLEIYVGYSSNQATWLPMKISRLEAYAAAHAQEERTNWIINGALLAMMSIALVMIPVISWRVSLSLCAYILAGAMFVFHAEGYTFQHVWPNRPGLNEQLNLAFLLSMSVTGPVFARELFGTLRTLPRFDRWLRIQIGIVAALLLLAIPMHQFAWFRVTAYPAVVVVALVHFATGVLARRARLLGTTPFLWGAGFVLLSLVYALVAHLNWGTISLERTLDVGQIALLAETIAFAGAIVVRVLGLRRERDQALRAELATAHEKIRLGTELRDTQRDYDRARQIAEERGVQLASVGHDIRQPLTALRRAVSSFTDTHEPAAQQVTAAFDYLEDLARSQSALDREEEPAQAHDVETFPVRAVLDNVKAIFTGEAADKALTFRYRPIDADVRTNAIGLMRLVNNLVANAIKHTDTGGVLLACRRRGETLRIEVWDTGPGMDTDELVRVREPRVKGETSGGDGLGLAIVESMAAELGFEFDVRSWPERGTSARITLPLAE